MMLLMIQRQIQQVEFAGIRVRIDLSELDFRQVTLREGKQPLQKIILEPTNIDSEQTIPLRDEKIPGGN